jgi:hypothetical protein
MDSIHDPEKVRKLEKDIRVHTSYKRDILSDIFHRYTQFYKPVWSSDAKIISVLDERLPDLLPAPHNIEFFVRTSERLSSLEEVLRHVETSKEMIKALGEWMASLPDFEQLFLIWLEISSTVDIITPDKSAAKLDLEQSYNSTLAHLFKKKYLSGIPTNPLTRSLDKFSMIFLQSRDENGSIMFNFVHPSYHEAFWYAIKKELSLSRWWNILKSNIDDIDQAIDLLQLEMIERYGTINRDFTQLLLISAESDDVREQLIALEHMSVRLDQFKSQKQFKHCINSLLNSNDEHIQQQLLNKVEKFLLSLPSDIIIDIIRLAFSSSSKSVRGRSSIMLKQNCGNFNKDVVGSENWRIWNALKKMYSYETNTERIEKLDKSHLDVNPSVFDIFGYQRFMNFEFRNSFLSNALFFDENYLGTISKNFADMTSQQIDLVLKVDHELHLHIIATILTKFFKKVPESHWKTIFNSNSLILSEKIIELLEEESVGKSGKKFMTFLSFPGLIQYTILNMLLLNFNKLSSKTKLTITKDVKNPSDWWVGGSIGNLTQEKYANKIAKNGVANLIMETITNNMNNKSFIGAFLAEMVQNHLDKDRKLNNSFSDIMFEISQDKEAIDYATKWIDLEREKFGFYDEEYWLDIKRNIYNLN